MTTVYLYVLPLHNEDWLKLGISNDPLRRAMEFSPRYFEAFDLEQAFLVETDNRHDAALLERTLRQHLRVHRAPMPLTIRTEAGGHTEWLRGAYPTLLETCRGAPQATALHVPAWPWFERAQWDRRMMIDTWSRRLMREFLLDPDVPDYVELPAPLQVQLKDAIDAFHHFGRRVDDYLPRALQDWYERLPGTPREEPTQA